MTKRTPTLLAPAALGNPITAWTRTAREIIVGYANGLILAFPFDRNTRRPGRRVSVHSRQVEKLAIELQNCDDEMIQNIQIDENGAVIAVVGSIGVRMFSSNQCLKNASIMKFDIAQQSFVHSNNFVLCSEEEIVLVKAGGYEALVVNLSSFSQVKVPVTLPRQAIPILYNSDRIFWLTESQDATTKDVLSYLTISRIKSKARPQKIILPQRRMNSPIDILDQYIAYVIGKSKEDVVVARRNMEIEGGSAPSSHLLWSCRAHRHSIVAMRLGLSTSGDILLVTISESSCVKLWNNSKCFQVFRLNSNLSFSLGYPYRVTFNDATITVVADEGLYEITA